MNIAIVGTGYVGLVSGTCFSEMGAKVYCIDTDIDKISNLNKGILPIYEPGLEEMVKSNINANRLFFLTELKECIDDVDIVFIAVGTPSDEDGSADLKYVLNVASYVGENLNHFIVLVTKSTVPVGTSYKVRKAVNKALAKRNVKMEFGVASNPEFLKEGAAIDDFMHPDRVVIGTDSEKSRKLLEQLYRPFLLKNYRVIFMDILSAEMTKYVSNAMLATRISFMNEVAKLCEITGADVNNVRKGVASDTRIGNKFLYPGCGYGGSCFPKDVKALRQTALENDIDMQVISAVERVNEKQKHIVVDKLNLAFKGDLKNKTIGIWGLSFKPDTDDIRESPSLVIIDDLLENGAKIRVFDPIAMNAVKAKYADKLTYCENLYDCAESADAVALLTEWKEFRILNLKKLKEKMKGNILVDGRNIYEYKSLQEEGFKYYSIGGYND
ncbi:MAG: UDP-glucose/GDP-mannose dehydrogenase family protein [Bacteroidales bacterium]